MREKPMFLMGSLVLALSVSVGAADEIEEKAGPRDNRPPKGFKALFNGKNLANWQGLVELPTREKLLKQGTEELAAEQKRANEKYLPHWTVKHGILTYDGKGQSLQTIKDYSNFELWVSWK